MDRELEDKLDHFEAVLGDFEKRNQDGIAPTKDQVNILRSGLKALVSEHTLARWWQEEIDERICELEKASLENQVTAASKFPQEETIRTVVSFYDGEGYNITKI